MALWATVNGTKGPSDRVRVANTSTSTDPPVAAKPNWQNGTPDSAGAEPVVTGFQLEGRTLPSGLVPKRGPGNEPPPDKTAEAEPRLGLPT